MQKSLTWIGCSFEQGFQFEFEIMVLEYALTFWESHSSWAVETSPMQTVTTELTFSVI